MIEQTILTALATTWLMQSPAYQRLVKPRYKETSLRITTGQTEYDQYAKNFSRRLYGSVIVRELPYCGASISELQDADWRRRNVKYQFYKSEQINPFNRKPFTCAYCMGFWLGVLFGGLSFILLMQPAGLYEALAIFLQSAAASILAEAFSRLYKLIPIKL